jgi:colanic acid biosynthesis protein WcaH
MKDWIPESLFSRIVQSMPICTVDVALFSHDTMQVLVFRRSQPPLKGHWFTLGGRLQKNESLRDCAVRHAKIETSLTLDPRHLVFGGAFDEIHDESRFSGNINYHCVNICWGYVVEENPVIFLDSQHQEYAWKLTDSADFHPMLIHKLSAVQRILSRVEKHDSTEHKDSEILP